MHMKRNIIIIAALLFTQFVVAQTQGAKMKGYVDALMKKMTLDEKIGQLNLITPGSGIPTGSVVSTDVENKIKQGKVGGLFGVIGVDKIKQAQRLCMDNSRLKIPLIFGSDVIHGYKTTVPIPLGLSASWDMKLIELSAREAAIEATADGLCWTFSPMVDIALSLYIEQVFCFARLHEFKRIPFSSLVCLTTISFYSIWIFKAAKTALRVYWHFIK